MKVIAEITKAQLKIGRLDRDGALASASRLGARTTRAISAISKMASTTLSTMTNSLNLQAAIKSPASKCPNALVAPHSGHCQPVNHKKGQVKLMPTRDSANKPMAAVVKPVNGANSRDARSRSPKVMGGSGTAGRTGLRADDCWRLSSTA